MKRYMHILAVGAALPLFAISTMAATITSTGTGNWSATGTWAGGNVPTAADDVVIAAGNSVTVDTAASCNSLTLNHGASSGATLTVSAGKSLIVGAGSGTVTVGTTLGTPASQPSSTYTTLLNVAGTMTCGDVNLYAHRRSNSPGRNANAVLRLSNAAALVTVSGNLNFNADSGQGSLNAGVEFTAAGSLKIGGNVTQTASGGSLTPGTGTVEFYAAGAQSIGNLTYNNLILSGTSAKTGSPTVNGTFELKETITYSGTPAYGANATLKYSGTTAQSSGNELRPTTPNININNPNGVTFNSAVTVTGTLTLAGGNVTAGANVITIGNAGSVSQSTGWVVGSIKKAFGVGANVTQTFEVGTASGYNPATVVITNVTVAGSLTVGATAGDLSDVNSSVLLAAQSVNVYWTVQTNGTLTFDTPASVALTFNNPADLDGGVDVGDLSVGKLDSGTWSYPEYELSGDSTIIAHNLSGFSTFVLAVEGIATATTLSVDPSTRVIGDTSSVSFTATVSPDPGGGQVIFSVNGTAVSTNTVSMGQASYSYNPGSLSVGTASVGATFKAFGNYAGSSDSKSLEIVKSDTSTAVGSTNNPSVFGQNIYVSAAVSVTAPGAVGSIGGTVTFTENLTTLADSLAIGSDGKISFSISTLSVGPHVITATYSGDGNLNGSQNTFTQIVNKASTDTGISAGQGTIAAGFDASFTATVLTLAPGSGTPTGNVTFKEGETVLSGPTAVDGQGKASFDTTTLEPGTHLIVAEYAGDGNYLASTGSVSQTITAFSTTNVVDAVNVFYQTVDQNITVTVNVTSAGVADGGTVTLAITNAAGAVITNSTPVIVTNGVAVITTGIPAGLAVGSGYRIVATYSGAGDYAGNVGVGTLTVNNAATTVVVPEVVIVVGTSSAHVTATVVASNAVVTTGTVNFQLRQPSGTGMPIQNVNGVSVVNGIAAADFTTTGGLSVTNYIIRCTYVAGANFTGSTDDGTLRVIASALTPTVTLTSARNPSYLGQSVIFTATVSGSGSTPTGTLQFTVNGGANVLPMTLVSGVATYTNTFSAPAGSYTIGAAYSGDALYASGSTNLSQTVNSMDPANLLITINGNKNALVTFNGNTNQFYHVETSDTVSDSIVWINLGPVTSTTGNFQYEDTDTANHTNRFYRVVSP